MEYGAITSCQLCGHKDLQSVVFLGFLPPVNMMRPIGKAFAEEQWFPAEMLYCPECHLVQLGYAVDPRILFPPEYPYTSGTTRILRENFAQLYQEVMKIVGLTKDDLIVDVGSNDGTLLSNFHKGGHRVAGIEPSLTAQIAEKSGIPTIMEYFDAKSVKAVKDRFGTPKIVTATNVFAHIHNIGDLMANITELAGPDGIFISESHYLGDLVETLQYDTIYHEHLRYYSLISIKSLLSRYGFTVFHVQRIPTHGGSIRVFAAKGSRFTADATVTDLLAVERKQGLEGTAWIAGFRERIIASKLGLYELLTKLKKDGARIHGIGAPSRASTLINYVGLDDGILDCVLEVKNSLKVGKYMPGRKIPVQDESRLYSEQPEYALLLSWHIAEELAANLIRNGYKGDFIVPLPEPRILRNNGGGR